MSIPSVYVFILFGYTNLIYCTSMASSTPYQELTLLKDLLRYYKPKFSALIFEWDIK